MLKRMHPCQTKINGEWRKYNKPEPKIKKWNIKQKNLSKTAKSQWQKTSERPWEALNVETKLKNKNSMGCEA